MSKKNFAAGNGLESFFADNSLDLPVNQTLSPSVIEPNSAQPRRDFDNTSISELAESIKIHGIIQPIIVRRLDNGFYQIVAGERRWRAAKMLGLSEVPVIIKDFDEITAMQVALIENLQRENLNPVEEALGYKRLSDEFSMKQEDIAKTVGKSRSAVANSLRILNLPDEILDMLAQGALTIGHAKALAGLDDEEEMILLARKAADGRMTVRDIERACAKKNTGENEQNGSRSVYYKEAELALREQLSRKVSVSYGKNKGRISIEFYDEDDLANIAGLLCGN